MSAAAMVPSVISLLSIDEPKSLVRAKVMVSVVLLPVMVMPEPARLSVSVLLSATGLAPPGVVMVSNELPAPPPVASVPQTQPPAPAFAVLSHLITWLFVQAFWLRSAKRMVPFVISLDSIVWPSFVTLLLRAPSATEPDELIVRASLMLASASSPV